MKIFFNVLGLLALPCGILALFLAKSAIHEILGAISILVAVTSIGFSTLIDRADALLKRVGDLQNIVSDPKAIAPPELPVAPDAQRFYIASGKNVGGPHDREALARLLERQIITSRSLVCRPGSDQWHELGTILGS